MAISRLLLLVHGDGDFEAEPLEGGCGLVEPGEDALCPRIEDGSLLKCGKMYSRWS